MSKMTIFRAARVLTMNPRRPVATHVAVRDGWILGAAELDELTGWGDYTLDTRFADKVLMPGFVEGHCHAWEGSAWEDTFVGYFDRKAPDGVVHPGLASIDAVVERMRQVADTLEDPDESMIAWGFDPIYFGQRRMIAADLDRVSTTRPVMVMHASGHIVNVNSLVLERAGITTDTDVMGIMRDAAGEPTGELQGPPLRVLVYKVLGRDRFLDMGKPDALWRFAASACNAGVTTATDLANELLPDSIDGMVETCARDDFPLRVVPAFFAQSSPVDKGVEWMRELKRRSHDKLRFGLVKLVADGSIQGFTARLEWPGYYNGVENGLWYIEPGELPKTLAAYHDAGLQVHIHTNGDQATQVTIDAIEQVLANAPSADARFTLQHCQMAHDAHFRRMAKLGICANLFANHLYYWGDQHYAVTMGPERAERMDAAGAAQRLGVAYAIHSDAPVTHLGPLFTAWCAVNRITARGRVLGAGERISVADALHAITIGAAYTLKLDREIGSIETGKRADFAVLDSDPTRVDPMALKDVGIWGTVLGGRAFEAAGG